MRAEVAHLRRPSSGEPPLSDEAIARACAAGDPSAIATLFDRFHAVIARYIQRLCGGHPDAEDLLQSTFLEVARGTATYDETRGGVRTWLFAIATNVVRHHRRSVSRTRRLLAAVEWARPIATGDAGADTDARRQLRRANEALEALTDDLREAFVLCELEGLSATEAAVILRTSDVAVWKRVSKARKAIRHAVVGDRS